MAIPVWVPGQVLTASDINNWMVPNAVVKPSDQSLASNITLQNDTALVLNIAANAAYIFTCYLDYEGGTLAASDLKWQWAVPSGAGMRYTATYVTTGGGLSASATYTQASVVVAGTSGAGSLQGLVMTGAVTTSTSSGTLQLKWAQNTSAATATIVHANSYLWLQRTS